MAKKSRPFERYCSVDFVHMSAKRDIVMTLVKE